MDVEERPWWHPWNWIDPRDVDSWLMTLYGVAVCAFLVAVLLRFT